MEEINFRKATVLLPADTLVGPDDGESWSWTGKEFIRLNRVVVVPNGHHQFMLRFTCDAEFNRKLFDVTALIKAHYFDPIRNRDLVMKSKPIR
jgi:hypothetical protein